MGLDAQARAMISAADTFLVASAHPGGEVDHPLPSVDVLHRGGKPGFVKVGADPDLLHIPDFAGAGRWPCAGPFSSFH